MGIHYKILGQVVPSAANTWTQIYPCPTGKEAVCSSLTVANLTSDDILYRVRVRQQGAAANDKQILVYDTASASGVSQALQLSMTLAAGDIVEVYAASTSIAFNLFGSELDA
jgi:hypothetical protein